MDCLAGIALYEGVLFGKDEDNPSITLRMLSRSEAVILESPVTSAAINL